MREARNLMAPPSPGRRVEGIGGGEEGRDGGGHEGGEEGERVR